jgi:hypothetical protein
LSTCAYGHDSSRIDQSRSIYLELEVMTLNASDLNIFKALPD